MSLAAPLSLLQCQHGSQTAQSQQTVQPPTAAGKRVNPAAALYAEHCANCHGDSMQGGRAQTMLDEKWLHGDDDASLARSISEGIPDADMPAYKGTLTDPQIRALVFFIREAALRERGAPSSVATRIVDGVIKSELHAVEIETVAEGVETPWGIAFLPGGRMLVTERPGRLRIIENGKLLSEPVAGTQAVWSMQDGGLLDVEAHPDYATNGWIYLAYAEPGKPNTSMTVVIRGRIRDGKWVDQQTLYRAPESLYTTGNAHYGLRFIFDTDGRLFYSIGDRGRDDAAQDLSSPLGKVHRVVDDGTAPPDNPFVSQAGALASIWSYGHRHPQGFAFHPITGQLWSSEHGPNGGDEVNVIKKGHNYGWPVISNGIMNNRLATETTKKEGMESPIVYYGPRTGVCPLVFYSGDRFPNWKNHLFLGTMAAEELIRLEVDGEKVIKQEVIFRGIGRVRDVVQGPDGYLYVALAEPGPQLSSTTTGRIIRLKPAQE